MEREHGRQRLAENFLFVYADGMRHSPGGAWPDAEDNIGVVGHMTESSPSDLLG